MSTQARKANMQHAIHHGERRPGRSGMGRCISHLQHKPAEDGYFHCPTCGAGFSKHSDARKHCEVMR